MSMRSQRFEMYCLAYLKIWKTDLRIRKVTNIQIHAPSCILHVHVPACTVLYCRAQRKRERERKGGGGGKIHFFACILPTGEQATKNSPPAAPGSRRLRRRRSGPKYCDFVYYGFQNLFTEAKKSGFTVRDSQGQSRTSTFVAKDSRDLFLGSWTTTL